MNHLLEPAFLLALTFGVYFLNIEIQKKLKSVLYNPLMFTMIMIIAFLYFAKVPLDDYEDAVKYIDFWLQPAIVALAIPLYIYWEKVKKQWLPILISQFVGSVVGIVSVVLIAKAMNASDVVVLSLASKSVTTPIAIAVTESLGGLPGLTALAVIITGIIGNVAGFQLLRMIRVVKPMSQSISIGTASHAIGTSRALEKGSKFGAFSSIGLIINGVCTAIIAPYLVPMLV